MTFDLSSITDSFNPSAPKRIIFYGRTNTGKSKVASDMRGAVFLPLEDGIQSIKTKSVPLENVQSYEGVIDCLDGFYDQVKTNVNGSKTIVVDTIDKLGEYIDAIVAKNWNALNPDNQVRSSAEIGWAKGPDLALPYFEEFIRKLNRLRDDRGFNICLIAHEKVFNFDDPEGVKYKSYAPAVHPKVTTMLESWCDLMCRAATDLKFDKKGKAKTSGISYGYATPGGASAAKNRYNFPKQFEFSWEEIDRLINKFIEENK